MRGVLIDPFTKTIKEVEWKEKGDGSELARILKFLETDDLDSVRISDHRPMGFDVIWVDGEGLFKPNQRYFKFADYPQPLAGKGLVLGVSEDGRTVSTLIDEGWVKSRVSWARPDLKFVRTDIIRDVETVYGVKMNVTRMTPIFSTADGTLIKDWEE